jgi:hypothetical protein
MLPISIPITKGQWEVTQNYKTWEHMYFMEVLLDWSMYPNCVGKLMVETIHNADEAGRLRLSYQQEPAKWIPVEGSIIFTNSKPEKHRARWTLLESDWFPLPTEPGVSCLWIDCMAEKGKKCSVALATLVIKEEVKITES